MPFVQVNDVKLHYEMEGSGPPLLMVAGTGRNVVKRTARAVRGRGFYCDHFRPSRHRRQRGCPSAHSQIYITPIPPGLSLRTNGSTQQSLRHMAGSPI
jgi:hypothetical protein